MKISTIDLPLKSKSPSLGDILAAPRIDGGRWPLLFTLVANEFDLPIEGPRGKIGCEALVALGCQRAELVLANAVQDGAPQRILTAKADVQRLNDIGNRLKIWESVSIAEASLQLPTPVTDTVLNETRQHDTQSTSYSLEVKIVSGKGYITRSVSAASYLSGSTITLTAIPNDGYVFKAWGGDRRGSKNACSVTMNSDKVVTVRFERLKSFQLVVKTQGNGTVLPHPLAKTYVQNSIVSLTAHAAEDSQFNGWYGDAKGVTNACTIQMNSMKTVVAMFTRSKFYKNEDTSRVEEASSALFSERTQILHRLSLLDTGALRKLDALQIASINPHSKVAPTQTLFDVLTWLATQISVTTATLRMQLLPLDMLPSAVIDDINERAYDLTGEAALDDSGDSVTVHREVLLQVLAAWDE